MYKTPHPRNAEHEVHARVYVCCAEGGVGEKEVGRGGGSTHLFEQFYFGAQSLDGLVVLAFEIIREACA